MSEKAIIHSTKHTDDGWEIRFLVGGLVKAVNSGDKTVLCRIITDVPLTHNQAVRKALKDCGYPVPPELVKLISPSEQEMIRKVKEAEGYAATAAENVALKAELEALKALKATHTAPPTPPIPPMEFRRGPGRPPKVHEQADGENS